MAAEDRKGQKGPTGVRAIERLESTFRVRDAETNLKDFGLLLVVGGIKKARTAGEASIPIKSTKQKRVIIVVPGK